MKTIKSLIGRFHGFGATVASCVTGFVAGMLAVTLVDTVVSLAILGLGLTPLTGITATVVGMALSICYMILYLVVALRVTDKTEEFIRECRNSNHFRSTFVYA